MAAEEALAAPGTVLIVEDEVPLREAIRDALHRHGYRTVETGSCAGALALAGEAELVLLDLGLPDGDALEICAALARMAPVIVVSARGDETDRVVALELGADDYLSKPFGARELVARCRSVLRRSGPRLAGTVRVDDLVVDLERLEVRRGEIALDLTTKEREIIAAIARRRGAVVRRQELSAEVWGSGWDVGQTLDVHMSSLRRKLGGPARQHYVETVHGVGFRLARH